MPRVYLQVHTYLVTFHPSQTGRGSSLRLCLTDKQDQTGMNRASLNFHIPYKLLLFTKNVNVFMSRGTSNFFTNYFSFLSTNAKSCFCLGL